MSKTPSSTYSLSNCGNVQVKVLKAHPTPEQWTLVREVNMERREPCEIWRSGANHQLLALKQQMLTSKHTIKTIEQSIAQDKCSRASNRSSLTDSTF